MKTLTVYCDKDLVFRWNEWPENNCVLLPLEFFEKEAEYKLHVIGYNDCFREYHTALELAKRESIPMEDQELAEKLIGEKCRKPKPFDELRGDTFYSFPFEGEVERVVICDTCGVNDDSDCDIYKMEECDFVSKEVARLTPSVPSESQEDILQELKSRSGIDSIQIDIIKKHYCLTRKHP